MPPKAHQPKIKKPKLLRSNPYRKLSLANDIDTDIDDEYICSSRNRARLHVEEDDNEEVSDYVKWRLFLARQLALLKYQEKWGA